MERVASTKRQRFAYRERDPELLRSRLRDYREIGERYERAVEQLYAEFKSDWELIASLAEQRRSVGEIRKSCQRTVVKRREDRRWSRRTGKFCYYDNYPPLIELSRPVRNRLVTALKLRNDQEHTLILGWIEEGRTLTGVKNLIGKHRGARPRASKPAALVADCKPADAEFTHLLNEYLNARTELMQHCGRAPDDDDGTA